jgi:hypothetical protein
MQRILEERSVSEGLELIDWAKFMVDTIGFVGELISTRALI